MSKYFTAVLINVTGIQQFIFHSNKLKENIGASYIIENEIYGVVMKSILQSTFGADFNIDLWKTDHEVKITENENILCEVGYIGGGNTLLLFKKKEKATTFIEAFSKKVLEMYPSLQLVFGLTEDFDLTTYKSSYDKLMQNLKSRKSSYIPLTTIPKHGITADCPLSNDSAEKWEEDEKMYVSKASYARIQAAKKAQEKSSLNQKYPALKETYTLTDDVAKLGQNEEGSYIAVVHIDGNGMGKIFSNINLLPELRKKSDAVSSKAAKAMQGLIAQIVQDYEKENGLFDLAKKSTKKEHKYILPIRPILVGGDDITFICEGRLGMYLAEKFISLFYNEEEQAKSKIVNAAIQAAKDLGKNEQEIKEIEIAVKKAHNVLMDGACAGVAIVKTHFPFYKAVHLAEELCAEAKVLARGDKEGNNKGSYISYYYSATTFSGSLAQLRERTHRTPEGKNMYFGPYLLFEPKKENSIEKLKTGIAKLNTEYPKNKVMALRDTIIASPSAQKLFVKELKEQLGHKDEIEIWNEKDKTKYFDQIELMDFYLPSLL